MDSPPPYTEISPLIRSNHPSPPRYIRIYYPSPPRKAPGWAPCRGRISRGLCTVHWCILVPVSFIICVSLLVGTYIRIRPNTEPAYVRKVAIIGAGPAGASAAYNIRKLTHERGILVDITVYEKASHIGGRSTCQIPLNDDGSNTVQIGARGFHTSNKILVDAVNDLGLSPVMLDGREDTDLSGRSGDRWGVFDGSSLVYRQAHPTNFLSEWWWNLKLYFFYGLSPRKTRRTVTNTLTKFSRIYSPRFFPFNSLATIANDLELAEEITSTGAQLLSSNGVSVAFQKDLVNSWSRRDFAQNLGTMSGLAAMTAPDDGGDMTVTGGHWGLFESMIKNSKVDLKLNNNAFGFRRMDWGGWVLASQPKKGESDPEDGEYLEFDTVILAAPYQFAGLEIKGEPLENVPREMEYAGLHITLFTSPRKLSGGYFHYNGEVPETILTTLRDDEFEHLGGRTGVDGVGTVGFYELKSVKRIDRVTLMGVVIEEWVYKVVSPVKMEDATIKAMLGAGEEEEGIISWIYRHEWPAAIPFVYPITQTTPLPPLKLSPNFYYTSSIESLGSSMEMSSLMGANVATLVVDEWSIEGKRGKRPERNFYQPRDESDNSTTLWPQTRYSWGKMVYEGIWKEKQEVEAQNAE